MTGTAGQITIEIREQTEDRSVLMLTGELSAQTYHDLEEVLICEILAGRKFVRLDLAGVNRIQSCIYGLFLEAIIKIEKQGGRISFSNVGHQAERIFRLLGVA